MRMVKKISVLLRPVNQSFILMQTSQTFTNLGNDSKTIKLITYLRTERKMWGEYLAILTSVISIKIYELCCWALNLQTDTQSSNQTTVYLNPWSCSSKIALNHVGFIKLWMLSVLINAIRWGSHYKLMYHKHRVASSCLQAQMIHFLALYTSYYKSLQDFILYKPFLPINYFKIRIICTFTSYSKFPLPFALLSLRKNQVTKPVITSKQKKLAT